MKLWKKMAAAGIWACMILAAGVTAWAGANVTGGYGNISAATVTGLQESMPYTGKAITQKLTVTIEQYDFENNTGWINKVLTEGTDYTADYTNNVKIGTASIILKGIGTEYTGYSGELTLTFKITKGNNPMTVKKKTAVVRYNKLKKKKQKIAAKKLFTVTGAQGRVTYQKKSGNKKILVAKSGKVTVKKGLKKGTYKVKVAVTAAGNTNYKPVTKTVTVKIKVK